MDDYQFLFQQEQEESHYYQNQQKQQSLLQQQIYSLSKDNRKNTLQISNIKKNHHHIKKLNDQFENQSYHEELRKFSKSHIQKLNSQLLQQITNLEKEIQQIVKVKEEPKSNQQSRQVTVELIQKKRSRMNKKTETNNDVRKKKIFGQYARNNQRILNIQNEQLYKLMLRNEEIDNQKYRYRLVKTCQALEQSKKKIEKMIYQIRLGLHLGGNILLYQKSQRINKHHAAMLLHAQKQQTKLRSKDQQMQIKIVQIMKKIESADEQLNYLMKEIPVDLKYTQKQIKQKSNKQINRKLRQAINNLKVIKKLFFGKQYILQSQLQLLRKTDHQLDQRLSFITQQNQNMIISLKSKKFNYFGLNQLVQPFLIHLQAFTVNSIHYRNRTQTGKTSIANQSLYINQKIIQLKKKTRRYVTQKKPQVNDLQLYQFQEENKVQLPIISLRKKSYIKSKQGINPMLIKFGSLKKHQNSKVISLRQFTQGRFM